MTLGLAARVAAVVLALPWLSTSPAPIHAALGADNTPPPKTVTIPGTLQSKLGCPGDWQPACASTYLAYDPVADVWSATFDIPAGAYEYKVALNDAWTENYGGWADRNGPNVALKLDARAKVTFVYDHKSHVVINSKDGLLPLVTGSFQSELGCPADGAQDCLASLMTDPEFDGVYGFATTKLPPGAYDASVRLYTRPGEALGDASKPATFNITSAGAEVYFGYDMTKKTLTISTEGAPKGNITKAKAHWVSRDTLVWNVIGSPRYTYELHTSPEGALQLGAKGITGGRAISLTFSSAGPGEEALRKFPHLAGFSAFKLSAGDAAGAEALLKGQVAVLARDDKGKVIDSAGVQTAGALDDVYAARALGAKLGLTWSQGAPTLAVWAPTARSVSVHVFNDASTTDRAIVPMRLDAASGVWSVTGDAAWLGKYFLYEVEVFAPRTGKVERNLVTDPYSVSLSANGRRSQFLDLNGASAKPDGWDSLKKPALERPADAVIYELHVRDFSINDRTLTPTLRGTFAAFTQLASNGMKHLKSLADAGLTHVHLLPAFDFATVQEDAGKRAEPDARSLRAFAPGSDRQAALVEKTATQDGFNWGYDPHHFNAPEGSYSTDPNGSRRVLEFRQMVQALNTIGLRVVMDVVYNHTSASGQDDKSVFDRIVPSYYHRLNGEGVVETSTCCQNTASEHAMFEKFMVDSVVMWARDHKVDGFRFDLMGHHMLGTMEKIRSALDGLTLPRDGVDGKRVILYGEGWDFGEVARNARGKNASQLNLAGTGIGSFNDRMRDGIRGGSPFDDPRTQGFVTGLALAPNAFTVAPRPAQLEKLLEYQDWIKLGLAGNVKSYAFEDARGRQVAGEKLLYGGAPVAYAASPVETVNYASAHDNETLFDKLQWTLPARTSMAQRVRANNLAVSLIMLGQGIPFFHAGDELLRSKSLDRDSYNSGDWFNALDFSYADNGWGRGLPPSIKDRWNDARSLLGNAALKPTPTSIRAATAHFREMLAVRASTPLFRLGSAAEVQERVRFLNNGPQQTPGLIAMVIDGARRDDVKESAVVVLFNASPAPQTLTVAAFKGAPLTLHPVLARSGDPVVRTASFNPNTGAFVVPARTAAVFVARK